MRIIISILLIFSVSACTSLDGRSLKLNPGMTKEQVINLMGTPDGRSFRGTDEALQYQGVIGYGQCIYITAWLQNNSLISTTQRRGQSIAGCGLGSREVDWGQMPKPTLNVNISTKNET